MSPHDTECHRHAHVPPPHPVPTRRWLRVLAAVVILACLWLCVFASPGFAATDVLTSDQEGCPPGTSATVEWTDDGREVTVSRVEVRSGTTLPLWLSITDGDGALLTAEGVIGQESATWTPGVTAPQATVRVVVAEPVYCLMVRTIRPEPAYAPPAPEPGDHRQDTAPAPTQEPAAPGSRVLHSL